MKTKAAFIILIFTGLLIACKSNSFLTSQWKPTGFACDGKLDEWSLPLRFGTKTGTLMYNIANDSTHLYVCFEALSKETMMKIMSSGFEVWVDTTGKKKQNVGLLFIPEHNPMEGERHSFIPGQKPDINMLKQRLLLSMNEIRTKGLAKLGETSIPFRNNTGIHTALNVNAKGDIVFELILPLGEIYKEKNNYLNQKKPISVGLIINAPKRHEEGEDQELKHGGDEEGMNGQGMYRGGGGGMHGGVGGGGMRHGGGHNMESGEMSTSDVEWQQLKLINQ